MHELQPLPHQMVLDDRRRLSLTGIIDVDSFDDGTIIAQTALGELHIEGEELQICRLNIESGDLSIEGNVTSLIYNEPRQAKGGVFKRIFK